MLPSTCLQKVDEQPEDADNQRNVTRMGSQPSDPSTTVHVPVTLTGSPGETTVVPSEYLPVPSGRPSYPSPCRAVLLVGDPACFSESLPVGEKVLCYQYQSFDIFDIFGFPLLQRQFNVKYLCPAS